MKTIRARMGEVLAVMVNKAVSSPAELESLRNEVLKKRKPAIKTVRVCIGTGCAAKGSRKLLELFYQAAGQSGEQVEITTKCVGCHGLCERGPIVVVEPEDILYMGVEEPDVDEIFRESVLGDRVVERLLYESPETGERVRSPDSIPFYKVQHRIVLKENGVIDPTDITEYIAAGGYSALAKALTV
ncbi:MAG: NAD(P)H-dependent oxidoreductase subunit E, partial [Spirochaetota bacterium]